MQMDWKWKTIERPGYFGRRRDEKVAALNARYGAGNWRLAWVVDHEEEFEEDFLTACKLFYERSYIKYLKARPELVDWICSYGECIDNAPTNIESGCDYTKQEAFSTHIQDIAVRNVLRRLGRKFEGPKNKILVIRSKDSEGWKIGPGNIPFFRPEYIQQPSLAPSWANKGSVEDFWQSNKFLQIKEKNETTRRS